MSRSQEESRVDHGEEVRVRLRPKSLGQRVMLALQMQFGTASFAFSVTIMLIGVFVLPSLFLVPGLRNLLATSSLWQSALMLMGIFAIGATISTLVLVVAGGRLERSLVGERWVYIARPGLQIDSGTGRRKLVDWAEIDLIIERLGMFCFWKRGLIVFCLPKNWIGDQLEVTRSLLKAYKGEGARLQQGVPGK